MFEVMFLICLALVWIIFASIQDLREREVANWLSFSLIIFALGFRFFYCLFGTTGFDLFYQGVIGLGIFFVLGNVFYYSRLFAGGDAKLMIAMGAVLPIFSEFFINLRIFIWFLFLFLFAGAIYGFIWSLFLFARNFQEFKMAFMKQAKTYRHVVHLVMVLGVILIALGFIDSLFFGLGILVFVLPYFYLYAKAVDEACMIKEVDTKKLTEGDWLYKDLKIGKHCVKASWEGLNQKEISFIQKKFRKIKIRQGIAFVPVFLISYLILLWVIFKELLFYFG